MHRPYVGFEHPTHHTTCTNTPTSMTCMDALLSTSTTITTPENIIPKIIQHYHSTNRNVRDNFKHENLRGFCCL